MFAGRLYGGRQFAGRLYHRGDPVSLPISPDHFPSGRLQPGKKSRLRHPAVAHAALQLQFGIRSTARLSLSGNATVAAIFSAKSKAGLSLSGSAEMSIRPSVSAIADSRDVVLEMLLLSD